MTCVKYDGCPQDNTIAAIAAAILADIDDITAPAKITTAALTTTNSTVTAPS
jgi:hypothetical protein